MNVILVAMRKIRDTQRSTSGRWDSVEAVKDDEWFSHCALRVVLLPVLVHHTDSVPTYLPYEFALVRT